MKKKIFASFINFLFLFLKKTKQKKKNILLQMSL